MRIVSGGQTGVDRAALEFSCRAGLPHGGWCPKGRLAEDGRIPDAFDLVETRSADPAERTERNVIDSDATLIVARDPKLSGGTALTLALAGRHRRPVLVVAEDASLEDAAARVRGWLDDHEVATLNVAGPRESQAPGLGRFVEALLARALSSPDPPPHGT